MLIFQIGWRVGRAANVTRVAILILGAAFRASAFDKTIRKKHFVVIAIKLLDGLSRDVVLGFHFRIKLFAKFFIFIGVRRRIMGKLDLKISEISSVLLPTVCDQLLWCNAHFTSSHHDRRAMSVISADVGTVVASKVLKAAPKISLEVFNHMAKMNVAIGIGECCSD